MALIMVSVVSGASVMSQTIGMGWLVRVISSDLVCVGSGPEDRKVLTESVDQSSAGPIEAETSTGRNETPRHEVVPQGGPMHKSPAQRYCLVLDGTGRTGVRRRDPRGILLLALLCKTQ